MRYFINHSVSQNAKLYANIILAARSARVLALGTKRQYDKRLSNSAACRPARSIHATSASQKHHLLPTPRSERRHRRHTSHTRRIVLWQHAVYSIACAKLSQPPHYLFHTDTPPPAPNHRTLFPTARRDFPGSRAHRFGFTCSQALALEPDPPGHTTHTCARSGSGASILSLRSTLLHAASCEHVLRHDNKHGKAYRTYAWRTVSLSLRDLCDGELLLHPSFDARGCLSRQHRPPHRPSSCDGVGGGAISLMLL